MQGLYFPKDWRDKLEEKYISSKALKVKMAKSK